MPPDTTPISRQAYVTGFSCANIESDATFAVPWMGHEHTGRPMPLVARSRSRFNCLTGTELKR